MGMPRYARKSDNVQADSLEELRDAGFMCWVISWPDDVLVWHPKWGNNWFRMLSFKTPDGKGRIKERKDQAEQNAFCALTGTPRVCSGQHAINALEAP